MKKAWPKIAKVQKNAKPAFLVDARIDGKGERRFFSTKAEAEGFAQICRVRRKNEGQGANVDARLAAYGWTVRQAIDFALSHLDRNAKSVSVESAAAALIDQKAAAGKSDKYQKDLHARLGRLHEAMPGKTIATITTADLDGFLNSLKVAPGTKNTFRRDIRTLWSFAEKRGWALAKVAKDTESASVTTGAPGILTPDQAASLLIHSPDAETTAYHAIGLFAGLRSAELARLDWKDIDLAGGFIHVGASVSKTRSRRLVPILPNLAAWLTPIAKPTGPLSAYTFRYRHENTRAAAGITQWPENGLRHSFVSYRLAATGDAAKTALEAGHDQAVLFRHYRELVRPAEAEHYFSILPTNGGKIIAMNAA